MATRPLCYVAMKPVKPLVLFDGQCGFCRYWTERGRRLTGETVIYQPSQDAEVATRFPEIPAQAYDRAVQFIAVDGAVYSGAAAVFRVLATKPEHAHWWQRYESSALFAALAEVAYRVIAFSRPLLSRMVPTSAKKSMPPAPPAVPHSQDR